jgi:glucose-1-phosphate adenylyltransferase
MPPSEASERTILRVDGNGRVTAVERAAEHAMAAGDGSLALSWAGDLMLSAAALPAVLQVLERAEARDDDQLLGLLAATIGVAAYSVLDNRIPGASDPGACWHVPASVEEYYDSQMDLCTPRPAFDLYNRAWPILTSPTGLGPCKVVGDQAGRFPQVLNSLVADGSVIQGGAVINSVVGRGVSIDAGAEIEDSVLLDGCRIGQGARLRRAVVGIGAVVAGGDAIGYGSAPPTAQVIPSGLTLLPAAVSLPAAAGAR